MTAEISIDDRLEGLCEHRDTSWLRVTGICRDAQGRAQAILEPAGGLKVWRAQCHLTNLTTPFPTPSQGGEIHAITAAAALCHTQIPVLCHVGGWLRDGVRRAYRTSRTHRLFSPSARAVRVRLHAGFQWWASHVKRHLIDEIEELLEGLPACWGLPFARDQLVAAQQLAIQKRAKIEDGAAFPLLEAYAAILRRALIDLDEPVGLGIRQRGLTSGLLSKVDGLNMLLDHSEPGDDTVLTARGNLVAIARGAQTSRALLARTVYPYRARRAASGEQLATAQHWVTHIGARLMDLDSFEVVAVDAQSASAP